MHHLLSLTAVYICRERESHGRLVASNTSPSVSQQRYKLEIEKNKTFIVRGKNKMILTFFSQLDLETSRTKIGENLHT